jgi:hypothetical protein
MKNDPKVDFEEHLRHKRAGGVGLDVHVSRAVWMGGILDAWKDEPFVAVGHKGWESESELTFFSSRSQVESLVAKLQAVADEAWPRSRSR